ncbi:MAG TPA: type II toxin-antitoxin system RelE/ParE family toxin [Bryobacterales bacterium]|nr:type II toxin-antitoxin system RelE/ParE family toxin [Bryobacterales bacterium]
MHTPKFTPAAIENIKRLPKNVKARLKAAIMDDLVADPEGSSKTLTGVLSEFPSFHWRDYRVVFKLDDDLKALAIVAVAKKTRNPDRNLYRRLETAVENGELAAKVLETLKGFR